MVGPADFTASINGAGAACSPLGLPLPLVFRSPHFEDWRQGAGPADPRGTAPHCSGPEPSRLRTAARQRNPDSLQQRGAFRHEQATGRPRSRRGPRDQRPISASRSGRRPAHNGDSGARPCTTSTTALQRLATGPRPTGTPDRLSCSAGPAGRAASAIRCSGAATLRPLGKGWPAPIRVGAVLARFGSARGVAGRRNIGPAFLRSAARDPETLHSAKKRTHKKRPCFSSHR